MNTEKLTKLINKKFPNYDIADDAEEIYIDFENHYVANYILFNNSDNKCVVFVGQNSTIYNHELFDNYNEADRYFKDCVEIFIK